MLDPLPIGEIEKEDLKCELCGMYFDNVDNGFWMKDVEIPLDMIFIDNGQISEIVNASPFDETNIKPTTFADANLEVNQGFCEKNNINVGNKVYKS